MSKDLVYHDLPYEKIVDRGGTPFLRPSRVIFTGSPTTAMGKYPPLYIPYTFASIDTKRILVVPDEGINGLQFEKVHVHLLRHHQIQAVTGRVPKAGQLMDRATNLSLQESEKVRPLFRFVLLAEAMGRGPLYYLFKLVPGASGSGWAEVWYREFVNGVEQRIVGIREVFKMMFIQISTDLIVSDDSLEKRIETMRRLMDNFNLKIIYSYPRFIDNGEPVISPSEVGSKINEFIAFMEHLLSQPYSDLFRQVSDLAIMFRDVGVVGYTISPVMGLNDIIKVRENPSKIKMLSPIKIQVERDSLVILLILAPSRDHAKRYGEDFQRYFPNSEVVATYGEAGFGEPKFVIAVPINNDQFKECLENLGKDRIEKRGAPKSS